MPWKTCARPRATSGPGAPRSWAWSCPSRWRVQTTTSARRRDQAGLDWCADWVNDESPYAFRTERGELVNLPLSQELEDRFIIGDNLHSEVEYADQLIDAADFQLAEAKTQGGRLLTLNLHPWVIGQPHRIGQLERVFEHLRGFGDQLWNVGPSRMLAAWARGR